MSEIYYYDFIFYYKILCNFTTKLEIEQRNREVEKQRNRERERERVITCFVFDYLEMQK